MSNLAKQEYWHGVVGEFVSTGLSARKYCDLEGLNYQMSLPWKRQLLDVVGKTGFAELFSPDRILLSSGSLEIEVDKDLPADSLSTVILALCQAAKSR